MCTGLRPVCAIYDALWKEVPRHVSLQGTTRRDNDPRAYAYRVVLDLADDDDQRRTDLGTGCHISLFLLQIRECAGVACPTTSPLRSITTPGLNI